MRRTGDTGTRGVDGWCSWTTVDDGYSYLPSISCGDFDLTLGRGQTWGAESEQHCTVTMIRHVPDDEEGVRGQDPDATVQVSETLCCEWDVDRIMVQCLILADRRGHPRTEWIGEAVKALWAALQESEAEERLAKIKAAQEVPGYDGVIRRNEEQAKQSQLVIETQVTRIKVLEIAVSMRDKRIETLVAEKILLRQQVQYFRNLVTEIHNRSTVIDGMMTKEVA